MALSTKYDPAQVEDKWYQHWMDKGHFNAHVNPDKKPFSIVIPPLMSLGYFIWVI